MERMRFGSFLALCLLVHVAHAATWTVTTTNSGGICTADSTTDANCTLDAAITVTANGDTILFALPVQTQTIQLATQSLNKSITIDGSPNGVVLDGNDTHPFFYFISGNATVLLSHLTFQHGHGAPVAGAIYISDATVTIDSCAFVHNSASSGGAIFDSYASLTILNSTFGDNQAAFSGGGGGAIFHGGPSLVIANSTIAG